MSEPSDRVEFYKDAQDDWRWRYVALNNRVMADSSEGYANKGDCVSACEQVTGKVVVYETKDVALGTIEGRDLSSSEGV